MPEIIKVQVQAETKSAEEALKRAQQLADSLGKKQATIKIKAEGLDGLSRQIKVVQNETAKLAMSSDTFKALSKGAITVGQAMEDMGMKVNRVNTDMQSFIDHATGVSREASQITAKTSMFGKMSDEAFEKYSSGAISAEQATHDLNDAAKTTGTVWSSLTKNFTAAGLAVSAVRTAISLLVRSVRQAISELKEMDKELTSIQIVTGMSDWEKWNMSQDAYAGAKAQGRTVTDYLSASERFARAGYRENIKDLTELSLVTQNIGGVTEETASKFLLAADAAWKMEGSAERLWAMLDGVSSIADQNATDIGKIAEAYTVAGSAFANAGETEASFAALIGTTTAATQRSGSEMARGLQTILYRVRQVKGEIDDGEIINAEDISNAAKELDKVGISILNDKHQLKSFTEIMGELAEIWDELETNTDKYGIGAKERLQNALAGNRRGNILFTLMDHWEDYEKMLAQFEEGAGTAAQKNAIYTESWAAATANLKTSWAELIGNLTENGGLFQELTEGLTGIFDILNAILGPLAEIKAFLSQFGFNWLTGPGVSWGKKAAAWIHESPAFDWAIDPYAPGAPLPEHATSVAKDATEVIEDSTAGMQEYAAATTESAEAIKTWQEYLADAVKEGKIELKLVNQIKDAFDESSEAIKNASKAISEEKDKDVKDIGDIYTAMQEAAEKGYYGSNAMQRGFEIFFSDEKLNLAKKNSKFWFNELGRYGVETYFKTIEEESNYGKAAFDLLWGRAKGKKGEGFFEITDFAGKSLVSAKETAKGFEFEFNQAGKSMEQFLTDLSDATGFSKTFLSSVIKSIGMYDESLEQWEESADKYDIEIKTNDGEVIDGIDKIAKAIAELPDKKEIDIILNTIETTTTVYSSPQTDKQAANKYAYYSGLIGAKGYGPAKASGKHDSYSGVALVNDEFPADGSKPELIISKSQGRAYIANGGRPALVNLASDDVVLNAAETRSALSSGGSHFPTFKEGKGQVVIVDPWGNESLLQTGVSSSSVGSLKLETTNPDEDKTADQPNLYQEPAAPDPSQSWGTLKKLIDYLLEKGEEDLKDQLKVLDDQLDELEAERKAQEESNKLQEKQEAVQSALLDLQKAQTERTVRYYNEETQQWEWMADQGSVQKAQEAYDKAVEDLNKYLSDQDYEARKAEIEARKEELQAQFDQYKESWASIVDAIEAPSGDIAAILDELRKSGTSTMKAQSGGIAELLNQLRDGLVSIGYLFGLGNINANTDSSSTTAETVFDSGGFAFGGGLMRKGNIGAETVIGPDITSAILNPVRNSRFSAFADSIRTLMSASDTIAAGSSYITNNSGGNIFVNGMKIGSDMMQKPFAEVMRTISLHVNEAI